jgi:exodeoxyribonuclease VII small subunit
MKSKKETQLTYSEAITELETIVSQIENEEVDVDILAEKIKRAAYLMKFCKNKLKGTEGEVKKLLTDIEESMETERENEDF